MDRNIVNAAREAHRDDTSDLDALLHPALAFEHPAHVVDDPDLTLGEKRAILASWASDACAVEAVPALRHGANGKTVTFDEIMDALRSLDEEAHTGDGRARYKKRLHIGGAITLADRLRPRSGKGGCGPLDSNA